MAHNATTSGAHYDAVSRLAGLVVIDVIATGVSIRRGTAAAERIQAMKTELSQMRGAEPGAPDQNDSEDA